MQLGPDVAKIGFFPKDLLQLWGGPVSGEIFENNGLRS